MRIRTGRSTFARLATSLLSYILVIAGLNVAPLSSASAAPSGIAGSIVLGSGNYFKTIDSAEFIMGAGNFTFET
jgi:hypothetical protein